MSRDLGVAMFIPQGEALLIEEKAQHDFPCTGPCLEPFPRGQRVLPLSDAFVARDGDTSSHHLSQSPSGMSFHPLPREGDAADLVLLCKVLQYLLDVHYVSFDCLYLLSQYILEREGIIKNIKLIVSICIYVRMYIMYMHICNTWILIYMVWIVPERFSFTVT